MKQQITKAAITNTFRRLLSEKPFERITVKEIVEECGLTRNTFYYYYDDIYDIVDEILSTELEKAKTPIDENTHLYSALEDALGLVLRDPKLVYNIFRSPKSEELRVYFARSLESVIASVFDARTNGMSIDAHDRQLVIDSFRFAFEGYLEKWSAKGMKADIKGDIGRIGVLFEGALERAIERCGRV